MVYVFMTSVLDLIGETPLIEVTRFDRGPCRLFLKLESANPSGSIKDRPARAMIEAAEADGRLKPGGTIVEATAGNTGLGLALVGGRKGYRIVLVVPDKMAREKILPALRYCREQDEPKRVVSLVCDSGAKYLSKVFNPVYAAQEGWDHERHGRVRDVVFSRFPEGEEVVVRPDDPLRTVFMRMRAADVSQLPVVDGDRIVGLVDESDMLGAVLEGSAPAFELPVKDVMVTRLETISGDAPIRELIPLFRRDLVAIVMDGSHFLGIATRLDLVNYFRIAQTS